MDNRTVHGRRAIDAGWLSSLPLALNFVSLVANAFIIRQLGEDGYGTLVVALGLSGATGILANLGMRALYTKRIAGADDTTTERLMEEQLGLRSILAIGAGVLSTALAWLLYPDDPSIVICTAVQSVGLIPTVGWTVLADILNARERFRLNASIAFIAGFMLTAISVAAAAWFGSPEAVATAYLVGPAFNYWLQSRAVRGMGFSVRYRFASFRRYRELLHEARALAANDLTGSVLTRLEGIWAPLLLGKAPMAAYAAGMIPSSRLSGVSDGVATAYFPAMAAAHNRDDDIGLRDQVLGMFTLALTIALPIGLFTIAAAPHFALLLFPAPEQHAARALCQFVTTISGPAIPLVAYNLCVRYAVQAAGRHHDNAQAQMRATVIGAILAGTLTLFFGAKGLGASALLRPVVTLSLQRTIMVECYHRLLGGLPWATLLLANLALGVGLVVTAPFTDTDSLLLVGAVFGTLALGYFLVVLSRGLVSFSGRGQEG